jgi:hypothetical protein
VVLDPELGMCAVGRALKDAMSVNNIYEHTMDIIARATALGGYRALSPFPRAPSHTSARLRDSWSARRALWKAAAHADYRALWRRAPSPAREPARWSLDAESSLIPKREFGNEGNSTGFPAHERAAGQGIGACRRCRLARGGALIYKWPVSSSPDDPFYLHTDAPPNPRGG